MAEAAVRSIALALAVGSLLTVTKLGHPRLRLLTWTGVLYISMMMPLLALVLPAIKLPLLPGDISTLSSPDNAQQVAPASALAPATTGMLVEPVHAFLPTGIRTDAGATAARPNTVITKETFNQGKAAVPDSSATAAAATARLLSWSELAVIIYLIVAAILLARVITGLILASGLRAQALVITDPNARHLLDQLCGNARSRRVRIAQSSSVSIPLATGALNPMILLPPDWREWDTKKLRAVLAHELSHVARRDALTQLLSAIHRSFFWFSPLPWWLHRRLVDLAEQASDDSALLAVKDPAFYAEVLLGFFQSLSAVPARWLGVSMARGDRAGRRIERMLSGAAPSPSRLERKAIAAIAMLAFALAVPAASLKISRASAQADKKTRATKRASTRSQSTPSTSEPLAPVPALNQIEPVSGAAGSSAPSVLAGDYPIPVVQNPAGEQITPQAALAFAPFAAPALAPVVVPAPFAAAPALAPFAALASPSSPVVVMQGVSPMALPVASAIAAPRPFASIMPSAPVLAAPQAANQPGPLMRLVTPQTPKATTDDRLESFVIASHGSTHFTGNWREGDADRIKALREKINGDFIWFTYNGSSYIITDAETIKAAEEFFATQEDVSRRQLELAREQAEISEKQANLSRQIAGSKVNNPDVITELNKLIEALKAGETPERLAELKARVAEVQSKLIALETEASIKESVSSSLQADLARLQSELAHQQSDFSRQQSRLVRDANRKVRALLERALSDGLAKPEP
jgi:beta-lactamase regulating signal transducer with metallopeptidase domain